RCPCDGNAMGRRRGIVPRARGVPGKSEQKPVPTACGRL
ncbi:uncharacterized protein METZ01_LOCUS338631, partial [marine metagenome]